MSLSHAQFARLASMANEPEGGFTTRVGGGEMHPVTSGYMVGGQAATKRIEHPIVGSDVATYHGTHAELLEQPSHALGAWHDEGRKPRAQVDLDVVKVFPHGTGEEAARQETVVKNERAYGELTPDTYTTHNNPFSTQRLTEGVESHLAGLRADPESYGRVVSGDVLEGITSWIRRSAAR